MPHLYLYDDARARTFEPFSLTRPVSELRAGAELIRRRWERATNSTATGFIAGDHLTDFEEFDAPSAIPLHETLPAGAIVVNSRCVIALTEHLTSNASAWSCDGTICAVRLSRPVAVFDLRNGAASLDSLAGTEPPVPVKARWLHGIWDFIAHLSPQLVEDIPTLIPALQGKSITQDVLGTHQVFIEDTVTIEPYVVFDASSGPILIRRGATISAFTRITGPCYIGEDATIVGDRIANCSIGEVSKIRGEINSSIVLGHSNKGHTGFVGHSYLGRWVNLGAGTTTSNLKNTYGTVQLWTPTGLQDTKQQFLGTMFGDHAKTGIGTMLTTGTVLSAGANVYGSNMPPKYVPPFSWGDGEPYGTFTSDKFLDVASRVMQRRHVTLSDRQRHQLARVHTERAAR
jgi:UDP-N-acetylglucosamine diphosphorylase/glucosamine-1-phosphate N-acetyltransferase